VTWIRAHFAQPVTVEEMAASVRMSASSFHERFKAVTSMSPLQYQKVLRLHEARRLMLNGPFTEDTSWSAMLDFVNFGAVLAAVWVMSWIERRRPAHGLPLDGHAASGFGAGALLGLGAMSLCAGGLWASGALRIGGVLQPIGHAVLSGTLWAVALCAVALFEESLFRGYALRTLGSAIRFWPAAVVLSALFAAAHVGNPGENAAGLVDLIRRRLGQALIATADDPCLESWLSLFIFQACVTGSSSLRRLAIRAFF